MKKCLYCNEEIEENDLFCGFCGQKQEENENQKQVEKNLSLKEKKGFAKNLIVENEGNKFKSIKEFSEKYNTSIDESSKFINEAYNILDGKIDKQTLLSVKVVIKSNNEKKATQSNTQISNCYSSKQDKILKTIIVSQNSRKKVGSTISRAAIGNAILGPIGLIAAASGKTKETTTFQIVYQSGKQKTKTVKNNSSLFKEYCKYLER